MISLDLTKAGMSTYHAEMLSQFVKLWCSESCLDKWWVEQDESNLTVWFEEDRDVVLFKLSEDFDYFLNPSTIQRFNI